MFYSEIVTPAPSLELLELAPTLELLREVDADASKSDLVEMAIRAASSFVVDEITRPLALQTYVEDLGGRGGKVLHLDKRPVEPSSVAVTLEGTALASSAFVVKGDRTLFRSSGWPDHNGEVCLRSDGTGEIRVQYSAGYVLPPWIDDWSAALSIPANVSQWVRPRSTTGSDVSSRFLFYTAAGSARATGSTEPNWSSVTAAGGTIVDGGVTWTARQVQELPETIHRCAYQVASKLFEDLPDGIVSQKSDGFSEAFSADATQRVVPKSVRMALSAWRAEL